jgi:hypothetical protein
VTEQNKKENSSFTEHDNPELKHQITCGKCGMVYEIRYIPEHCRKVEGEGYLCMNCNAVLENA